MDWSGEGLEAVRDINARLQHSLSEARIEIAILKDQLDGLGVCLCVCECVCVRPCVFVCAPPRHRLPTHSPSPQAAYPLTR
jgi:hypothetical protein